MHVLRLEENSKMKNRVITVRLSDAEYGLLQPLIDNGVSVSRIIREMIHKALQPPCVQYSWNSRTKEMRKGGC